jgi:hypothetical protein
MTYFTWDRDGLCPLLERDADGNITAEYVRGYSPVAGIGDALMVNVPVGGCTNRQYPIYDHRGNVVRITDQYGTPTGYFEYDPFGITEQENPPPEGTPLRFSGPAWRPRLIVPPICRCPTSGGPFDDIIVTRSRPYHAGIGRFLQRDPVMSGGFNLYSYAANDPLRDTDAGGAVTFEQMNAIAAQLLEKYMARADPEGKLKPEELDKIRKESGLVPMSQPHPDEPADKLIAAIQRELGVEQDGQFGPNTVAAYEAWAKANALQPVRLRDSRKAKEVYGWIIAHWPARDLVCPVGPAAILALLDLESRDPSTATGGKGFTYFNAIGGPYGMAIVKRNDKGEIVDKYRTTAVGLAQFVVAKASREIAYDAMASVREALRLMHEDAARFGGNFEPNGWFSLNMWEAWHKQKDEILRKARAIEALWEKKGGGWQFDNITNAELNTILGIRE